MEAETIFSSSKSAGPDTAPLEVLLNGERRLFRRGSTLADVLAELGLPQDRVAIEFERQIVKRDLWAGTALTPGAEIEIVQFVGGG